MNQQTNKNPFVFACGVPRSGTTLLQRMLNSHPEMAVANDTHFIPRALELTDKTLIQQAQTGASIELTDELADNVFQYHRFRRLGLSSEEFDTVKARSGSYQELVAGLYAGFGSKHNKPLAGEKTPDYLRRLSLLHGLFPDAKLIHLVRDGRNVALSLLDWATPTKGPGRLELWNEHPIGVCALWWKWFVDHARQQSTSLPTTAFLELRYEDLVDQPEQQMRLTCDFLGLDFHQQMLEYHRGKSKSKSAGKLSAKSAWLAPQKGLRDWRSDMSREQIELFEILAGDALKAYGYSVASSEYSDLTVEAAKKCNQWWEQNFLPKHESKKAKGQNSATNQSGKSLDNLDDSLREVV